MSYPFTRGRRSMGFPERRLVRLFVVAACLSQMALCANANVRDFGATGDGATDDGPAIARALRKLSDAGGGTLMFPAGTYVHSAAIVISSPMHIEGAGSEQTTLLARSAADSAIVFRGASDCGISALRLVGQGGDRRQNDESAGILLFNVRNCTVDGVRIENMASAGILVHASRDVTITGNVVRDTKADGIHVVAGSSGVLIARNQAESTGDDSFAAVAYGNQPQTEGVTIRDNTSINSHARGVTCIGAKNCVIENNTITNPASHGIAVAFEEGYQTHHPSETLVTGNHITAVTHPGMNAILVDGATNVILRDNTIQGSNCIFVHRSEQVSLMGTQTNDGIGPGILVRDAKGARLIGNSIQRSSQSGIVIDHVVGAEVSQNTLTDVKAEGNENSGDVDVIASADVKGSRNISVHSRNLAATRGRKQNPITQSPGSNVEVQSR